jgi:hypothetical protein
MKKTIISIETSFLLILKGFINRLVRGRDLTNVDYIIPYGFVEIDNKTGRYTTKDFTGLYFASQPRELDVIRAFNTTLEHKDEKYIKFIDGLIIQAQPENKLRFLYWVREQMQLDLDDIRYYKWFVRKRKIVRTQSILTHVNLRINEFIKKDLYILVPYPWSDNNGATKKLVELGIQILENDNLKDEVKSEKEFVIWLGNIFGKDVSGSYKTIKDRIKSYRINDFEAYKFAKKISEGNGK